MTRHTHGTRSTQGTFAIRDALNHVINKDLLNIICEFYEIKSMTLLLSEFSDTYKYHDDYRQLIKRTGRLGRKQYNYAKINNYVFESRVRFVGSMGLNIFDKSGQSVGELPNRYFATLVPCDLS